MTTTESNKLIAEFMEIVFHDDENQYYNVNGLYIGSELLYHTSWDWLMPVVQKIIDLSFEEDGEDEANGIRDCMPDLPHTYKAVIQFINLNK